MKRNSWISTQNVFMDMNSFYCVHHTCQIKWPVTFYLSSINYHHKTTVQTGCFIHDQILATPWELIKWPCSVLSYNMQSITCSHLSLGHISIMNIPHLHGCIIVCLDHSSQWVWKHRRSTTSKNHCWRGERIHAAPLLWTNMFPWPISMTINCCN